MARRRRPLSRVPGFRPAPYVEFMERLYMDVGITEDDMQPSFEQMEAITRAAVQTARKLEWIEANHAPYPVHVTEYAGETYVTPPIYGKENDPIDLVQSRRPATDVAEADPHTQE